MHQFFQQFTINPEPVNIDTSTPQLKHNLFVLEMYNNWPFVRCMMFKYRENRLKQVDEMEHAWLNYILQNNIDAEADKTGEQFLHSNLKQLADDK